MNILKRFRLIFATVIFVTIAHFSFSQLTVEIGADTTFCAGLSPDTMRLGDQLSVKNGTPPYSYKWETKVVVNSQLIYTASDFLNDTTVASPYFKGWFTESEPVITFVIHITDNYDNYGSDSIDVSFSGCGCVTGIIVKELQQGDSLLLDAGTSEGRYEKMFWEPQEGLFDPDSSLTWCKPDSNTVYSLVKIDTFGCICSCPVYDVRVITTYVSNIDLSNNKSLRIRQFGDYIYFDNPQQNKARIFIYSINGKLIKSLTIRKDRFAVNKLLENNGTYIIKIIMREITDEIKIINFKK